MTFTFTMDAFPGYTIFDKTHKVLCVLQVVDPDEGSDLAIGTTVMEHYDDESFNDSDSGGDGGDTGDTGGDGGDTGDTGGDGGDTGDTGGDEP